jgi:DASS family divalent anion:Na+ symporter
MLPEQVREQFSWMYWFIASLVAAVVLLVLFALLVKFMFRNQEIPILSRESIDSQLKILGPIDLHEWAAILGIAFLSVGILTGSIHKISPAWISLIVLYIFLTIGIFSKNQFRINIDWSFLFLLAGMIGIIKTMSYIGIDQKLSTNLFWLIPYMKENFPLFVLLLSVSIILVRFIIPNNPTIMIFAAIFIPVAENSGVNPWVVVFIILMMSDTWFMRYQSTYYVVFAEIANPDNQYEEKALMKFNMLSIFIRLAAIYASLPFWSWLHII